MKRLAIIAAVAVAGCGDSTAPDQKLAQCADSWNRTSSEKGTLVGPAPKVRVSRFDGGECALVTNVDGIANGFARHDGRWANVVEPPGIVDDDELAEYRRVAEAVSDEANREPNVTVDRTGQVRPIPGAKIGELGVDL